LNPDYIILSGRDLITNISYQHKNLCIFTLDDEIKFVLFKPRPYGYPAIKGFQYFGSEEST